MQSIPKLAAPVVMVHGISAFDRLFEKRRPTREYFPGVRPMLEAAGNRVLMPKVAPMGGVPQRAAQLKDYLRRELGTRPFHLVGHSLGGLDARHLVARLGIGNQAISVTTMGTPNAGSSFADWLVARFVRYFGPLLEKWGMPHDGVFDLTTERSVLFNDENPDVPGVRYFSVAGTCDRPMMARWFRMTARIVEKAEGPNDGVVSVASAAWGERSEVWAGDHLNLVNWPNKRLDRAGAEIDRAADYARLMGHLKFAEG